MTKWGVGQIMPHIVEMIVPNWDKMSYTRYTTDHRCFWLVGIASGYSHFFGKDIWDDFGFIPLAASGKYKFDKIPLFVGLDLGGAISVKDGINSGLYVYPKVGFQLPKAELYLGYQNIGSERPDWYGNRRIDSNFGAINLGVNFFLK